MKNNFFGRAAVRSKICKSITRHQSCCDLIISSLNISSGICTSGHEKSHLLASHYADDITVPNADECTSILVKLTASTLKNPQHH